MQKSISSNKVTFLRKLDAFIDEAYGADDTKAAEIVDSILSAFRSFFVVGNNSTDVLFSIERPLQERSLVAASLVSLLSKSPQILSGYPWSHLVTRLFDEHFRPLYGYLKINTRSQPYERERQLVDALDTCAAKFRRINAELRSIEGLGKSREAFIKALRSPDATALLSPLIADELLHQNPCIDLFNSAITYEASDAGSRFTAFKSFIEAKQNAEKFLDTFASMRSTTLFAELSRTIIELVEKNYDSDDAVKSTQLNLIAVDRKYPLGIPNHRFSIGVTVSNEGPGMAFDLRLESKSDLSKALSTITIPEFRPGTETLSILAETDTQLHEVAVECALFWSCADGSRRSTSVIFELESQRQDLDWESFFPDDQYSIEPVTDESHLVGRQGIMKELVTRFSRKKLPSYLLHGQKRVGKTSIVRTLKSILEDSDDRDLFIVYVESGDFRTTEGPASLEALGTTLSQAILNAFPVDLSYELPIFKGSISPLGDLLARLVKIRPNARFLMIIDEFDELPPELYHRGPIGETLFLNLRGLSNKDYVGFILIGSEKMDQIQNLQGEHINKWESRKLDYFDRDAHWNDFVSLVRRPSSEILEITDDAVDSLYVNSAGNPYFTNILCRQIATDAVFRRDAFVSRDQVARALSESSRNLPASRFAHFWDDGILETGNKKEIVSVRRRRVLLAIADLLRRGVDKPRLSIASHDVVRSLGEPVIADEIAELERREILNQSVSQEFSFKVKLFEKWLMESGVSEIITRFQDEDAALAVMRELEDLAVKSAEIVRVCNDWFYQGRHVGPERVRAWLNQFGPHRSQRLVFRILENLKFYSEDLVRQRLRDSFNIFARRFVSEEARFFTKRPEFLVTYLDEQAKSGSLIAKLFADENRLFDGSVVEPEKIRAAYGSRSSIKAVIAVDDFIGTGKSLRSLVAELLKHSGDLFMEKKLALYMITVAGMSEGVSEIRDFFASTRINGEVIVLDTFESNGRCFSDDSSIYPIEVDRREAEQLVRAQGELLEKKWPVGFGDSQATIVFSHGCPNNTLPILWKESRTWTPLFPRK